MAGRHTCPTVAASLRLGSVAVVEHVICSTDSARGMCTGER